MYHPFDIVIQCDIATHSSLWETQHLDRALDPLSRVYI